MVRASVRALAREFTRRSITAAQRRHLSKAIIPAVYTPTSPQRRELGTLLQRRQQSNKTEPTQEPEEKSNLNARLAHTLQESDTSDLVTEVRIPDDPHGVLPPGHPALSILGNSSLVIQRQIELMNVLLSFEQANKYIIMDGEGQTLGYIAERDHGIGSSVARNLARTHRSFTTYIFDKYEQEVLRIHRPFSYINSKIRIYDPIPKGGYGEHFAGAGSQDMVPEAQVSPLEMSEMRIIGECQSQWTPLRRKYNLFTYRSDATPPPALTSGFAEPSSESTASTETTSQEQAIEARMEQFSKIDEPLLAWDFNVKEEDSKVIGSVNRNFRGFAREIFTDTGVYVLRMDAAAQMSALETAEGQEVARYEIPGMTLDQRAVMIATAVSIDFDYFSRHSSHGGGMPLPIFFPMGGATAEGAAGAGAAGAAGAAGEAGVGLGGVAAGAAGRGIAGAGAMESGIAGAGTIAGVEAMQSGFGQGSQAGGDPNSPVAQDQSGHDYGSPADQPFDPRSYDSTGGVGQSQDSAGQDAWGADQDPWSESASGAGDAGSEGGGGIIQSIIDWFTD